MKTILIDVPEHIYDVFKELNKEANVEAGVFISAVLKVAVDNISPTMFTKLITKKIEQMKIIFDVERKINGKDDKS